MRYSLLVLIFAVVCVAGIGCDQSQKSPEPQTGDDGSAGRTLATSDEPPLLLDDEPLLLLDDEPDPGQPGGSGADNGRCFVCHVNYMQEDIAVTHARADIGCAGCHGESDEHIADESWASGGNGTPPDVMYTLPKVNPFCMGCHPKGKIDTEQHKPLFTGGSKERYCTDCHGDHRLANRKCKWK